jgi:ubiquinone/menaquinone biosynthesis C-methylase UbiE
LREHYEQLWERLPEGMEPFAWEERRALLLEHVRPGARVLDLGCGEGDFAAAAADAGAEVVGVEVAEAAVDRARRRHPELDVRLAPVDGPLPVDDGAFDLVWCSEVLEHVADTQGFLSEARRVLAPGGRLVVTVPFHGRVKDVLIALARWERHFDPMGDHLRFYTARSLREALAFMDLQVESVRAWGGWPLVRTGLLAVARRPG